MKAGFIRRARVATLVVSLVVFAGCASSDTSVSGGTWSSQVGVTARESAPEGVAVRYNSATNAWEYARSDGVIMRYDPDTREWYRTPLMSGRSFAPVGSTLGREIDEAARKSPPQDDVWK